MQRFRTHSQIIMHHAHPNFSAAKSGLHPRDTQQNTNPHKSAPILLVLMFKFWSKRCAFSWVITITGNFTPNALLWERPATQESELNFQGQNYSLESKSGPTLRTKMRAHLSLPAGPIAVARRAGFTMFSRNSPQFEL